MTTVSCELPVRPDRPAVKTYTFSRVRPGVWAVLPADAGLPYYVDIPHGSCTCKAFVMRGYVCKHMRKAWELEFRAREAELPTAGQVEEAFRAAGEPDPFRG